MPPTPVLVLLLAAAPAAAGDGKEAPEPFPVAGSLNCTSGPGVVDRCYGQVREALRTYDPDAAGLAGSAMAGRTQALFNNGMKPIILRRNNLVENLAAGPHAGETEDEWTERRTRMTSEVRSMDEFIIESNRAAAEKNLSPLDAPRPPLPPSPSGSPPRDSSKNEESPKPPQRNPGEDDARSATANLRADNLEGREERGGRVSAGEYGDAGRGLLEAGDAGRAASLLDRAVKRDPENPDILTTRARARLALGDRPGAVSDAAKASALDPGNSVAKLIVGQGDALRRTKTPGGLDFGGGAGASERFPGAGGAGGEWRPQLAPRGPGSGPPQARPSAAGAPGAAGAGGASAPAVLDLVRNAERRLLYKDARGALLDLSQAVAAEPRNAKALALRAQVSNQLKNYPAALKDAEAALAADPRNLPALLAKAYALVQLGRHEEALRTAEAALSLDPRSAMALLYRAMALEKLGRAREALADFEMAARLDPSLQPFYDEAKAAYAPEAPAAKGLTAVQRLWALRAGAATAALLLIALGLFGTESGRKLTTTARKTMFGASRPAEAPSASGEATLVELGAGAALVPGTVIGEHFRIVRELGRGGMGVVYEAEDAALERKVAIKQLQRDARTTTADFQRFLAEARLVAKLRHPNLAEIHSIIEDGDLFLVFDFVEGQALDAALSRRGFFRPEDARRILAQVCAALDCAHGQRIIHRDLKPANVMLSTDGTCRVMDFGIAHQSRSGGEMTKTMGAGTPPYMAPEQVMGAVSRASDLYALAVMAYEMLSGRRPFPGPDFYTPKTRGAFEPVTRLKGDLPKGLDAFFAKALAPEPSGRFQSAPEFLQALDAALSS